MTGSCELSHPSTSNDRFIIDTYANHTSSFHSTPSYPPTTHDIRQGWTLNCQPSQPDQCGSASNYGPLPSLDYSQAQESHRQGGTCRISPNFFSYPSPSFISTPSPKESLPPSNSFMYSTGGVLDSPVVVHVNHLCSTPLSPPPTNPSRIHALPDAEAFECFESPSLSVSELDNGPINLPVPVEPLSPLSPEWVSNRGIDITSEDSALLAQVFQGHCSRSPRRIDSLELPDGLVSPPPSPILSDDGEDEDGDFNFLSGPDTFEWPSLLSPPTSPAEPFPALPVTPSQPSDFTRPFLHRLDIPSPRFDSTTHRTTNDVADLPIEEPPFISPIDDIFATDPALPRPKSEPIALLPEIDDDLEDLGFRSLPCSPSRRQCRSLPEWEAEESEPASPGQYLLSLPGTDADDDLIPADLSLPSSPLSQEQQPQPYHQPQHRGKSLLLIDDPNDVPPPRSPSPEHFDLDTASLDEAAASDPDLQKLCDLRKRAVAAERAARQLEAQMLEQGDVWQRAEARKVRKREKERCRELGALLRLKLGDTSQSVGQDKTPAVAGVMAPRGISSLPQLVARMMFRRNDRFRPLANRSTSADSSERRYIPSPLSAEATPCLDEGLEDSGEVDDVWP